MVKGTTSRGFEFCYNEEKLNDMKFIDALSELEENPLKLSAVINFFVTGNEKEALYKSCEDENGRVPLENIQEAITEMMETKPETKNS